MTHPFEDDIAFYYEEMGRVGTAGPWKAWGPKKLLHYSCLAMFLQELGSLRTAVLVS